MIIQQLINGLMLGSTYSLVAIGYTLIFGVLGLLHFAHGEVLMAGAFMGLYIILWSGLPLYIALPLTMIVTGLLGLIIEFLAIRPLRKDFHLAPLLSTIGVTIILQNLAVKLFGGYGTKFPDPIATANIQIGPYMISSAKLIILAISLSLMVILYFVIAKTKVGKAMRAVAESHLTAGFLGVNVERIVLLTFGIASALAGAAGVMVGISFHAVSPFIGLTFALKGLVVMLLGGLGNVVGAMIGGLILGVAEVISIVLIPPEINLQDVFSFGIMILILIFKPSGLFGSRVRPVDRGDRRLDYLISVATVAGISIIMALSFYLPFMTGQISLGQAGFAAIGAYGSAVCTVKFGIPYISVIDRRDSGRRASALSWGSPPCGSRGSICSY